MTAKSKSASKKSDPKSKKQTPKKEVPENVDAATGEIIESKPKTTTQKDMVPSKAMDPLLEEEENKVRKMVKETAKDQPSREAALSIVGGVTTEQLKQALVVQTEQRKLIQDFIKENLVEGIDYGKIHVVSSCPDEKRARGSCQKDYHFSKSILFKPGQEKIFSLFSITDELEKDVEAMEMLGNVPGLVALKCTMYRGQNKVGEGRGAASLSQSQNDPNSCIKKAEKRARMDACLSLGFSAYFTQDLDDPDYKSQREMMNERAKHEAEARDRDENGFLPRDEDEPIDNAERTMLHRLIVKAGFEDRDEILEFLKSNGVVNPESMTSGEARKLINKMKATEFLGPEKKPETKDTDDDQPHNEINDEPIVVPPKAIVPAELEIDDDVKNWVQENFETIGLNARGKMWFMQQVTGRPFNKWSKLKEEEWRRAYRFLNDILDVKVEVEDAYMAGVVQEEPADDVDQSPPEDEDQVQQIFPGAEELTEDN